MNPHKTPHGQKISKAITQGDHVQLSALLMTANLTDDESCQIFGLCVERDDALSAQMVANTLLAHWSGPKIHPSMKKGFFVLLMTDAQSEAVMDVIESTFGGMKALPAATEWFMDVCGRARHKEPILRYVDLVVDDQNTLQDALMQTLFQQNPNRATDLIPYIDQQKMSDAIQQQILFWAFFFNSHELIDAFYTDEMEQEVRDRIQNNADLYGTGPLNRFDQFVAARQTHQNLTQATQHLGAPGKGPKLI